MRESTVFAQVRATLLMVLMLPAFTGCSSNPRMPRDRFGALPYPGLFTHYSAVDPKNLGVHRYGNVPRLLDKDETTSGIVYTTRAGFLDIAHVRITVDTVRYCVAHLRTAVHRGDTVAPLKTLEGSIFHVELRYPAELGAPG